ncbi:MAG: hypothetical protein ABIU05_03235, partial [Nitrospirales bacterium]
EAGSVVLANRNKQCQASSYALVVRIRQVMPAPSAPRRKSSANCCRVPNRATPYERCNLWLLYRALSYGIDIGRFLSLWNGSGADQGDGTDVPGSESQKRKGHVDRQPEPLARFS